MQKPTDSLCSLMKSHMDIITIHSTDEIHSVLKQLQSDGVEMIIGGMTPHRIAQEMGMNAILITSGVESLRAGLEEAISIGASFQKLRKENFFLTSIMRGEAEQITVLDEFGELYYSAPAELPPDMLSVLREKIPEIPLHSPLAFTIINTPNYFVSLRRLSALGPVSITFFIKPTPPTRFVPEKAACGLIQKANAKLSSETAFSISAVHLVS